MGIKMKRSSVAGKAPAVGDVELGELAVNTHDGKLYLKKNNGSETIVEIGAQRVTSVAGRTGAVTLAKADVGLGNVDNTTDAAKPVSTATQAALDALSSSVNAKVSATRTIATGAGLTGGGDLSANRTLSIAAGSNGYGTRTVSTSDPSGGADGDIWIKV